MACDSLLGSMPTYGMVVLRASRIRIPAHRPFLILTPSLSPTHFLSNLDCTIKKKGKNHHLAPLAVGGRDLHGVQLFLCIDAVNSSSVISQVLLGTLKETKPFALYQGIGFNGRKTRRNPLQKGNSLSLRLLRER